MGQHMCLNKPPFWFFILFHPTVFYGLLLGVYVLLVPLKPCSDCTVQKYKARIGVLQTAALWGSAWLALETLETTYTPICTTCRFWNLLVLPIEGHGRLDGQTLGKTLKACSLYLTQTQISLVESSFSNNELQHSMSGTGGWHQRDYVHISYHLCLWHTWSETAQWILASAMSVQLKHQRCNCVRQEKQKAVNAPCYKKKTPSYILSVWIVSHFCLHCELWICPENEWYLLFLVQNCNLSAFTCRFISLVYL